jgi:hypothetical protein
MNYTDNAIPYLHVLNMNIAPIINQTGHKPCATDIDRRLMIISYTYRAYCVLQDQYIGQRSSC